MTRIAALGCIAILVTINAQARETSGEQLLLRVQSGNIPVPLLTVAMADVATIFNRIGVKIRWISRGTHEGQNGPLATCGQVTDVSVIDILIQQRSHAQDHPGALAYALPFAKSGFRVVVFYDRITEAISPSSAHLLGHVLAHEVGHMVIGTCAHSPQGVMTAHWTGRELASLQSHPLRFTVDDEIMIHRRIDQQQACFLSAAADDLVKLSAR